MKKILIVTVAIVFTVFNFQVWAQQVIASSGGYYENENLSVSWTLGEPVIETFTNGDMILTQGFQQPYSFYLQQILNIPMGWSGVSSYLDPVNKGMDGIFSPYQNDLIIMASMSGVYYPSQSINTIGDWGYETGYQIKAENDFDLTITGSKIQNPTFDLPGGWSLIPVLSACDVDVENLFSGISSLQIVKEVAGTNLYWPEYNINTLGNLTPGKAYFVSTLESEIINFPECIQSSPSTSQLIEPLNNTPWSNFHCSSSSHIIALPAGLMVEVAIMPGDVIGAFTPEGLCAGRLEISNSNHNFALTAFANDELTEEKDGFENGEPFHFKIYRPEIDQEFDLEVSFDAALPNMGYFVDHGLSAVQSLKLQSLGFNETVDFTFEVYPNPSHGVFNVSISRLPQNLKIQITDIRGSIIKEQQINTNFSNSIFQIDLSGNPKGVYFMSLHDDGFVGIKKLVVE